MDLHLCSMGSRDEDTIGNDFDTLDLLTLAREEGQRTIDNQIETFNDIDDKAARILRMNLLVLSILLTGFSIVATDGNLVDSGLARELENWYVFAGVVSILVSTILAAFTYTGSNYRSGMSGRDLENKILNADIQPIDALYDTAEGYSEWAQHNFKVNTRLAPTSTAMLLTLIYGLILLTAGVFHAFIAELGMRVALAIGIILLVITFRTRFHQQIKRYWKYRDFEPGKD